MRQLFYGLARDQLGSTVLLALTFPTVTAAKDWADWQRTHKGDATVYRVVRIVPTDAKA